MTIDDLKDKARYFARLHDLNGALVCAVVEQESNWAPWAIRYEPAFQKRYVEPLALGQTETVARSISWGLMQLMGQSAREMGFNAKMASLCDPDTGLDWGCRHLKAKLDAHGGDVRKGLLAWNGGGNAAYPDEVLAKMESYTQ
ncbi:MAG TPA: lytic transglycosylase domain-containing protein [Candidatus Angelobacter sp.]|jgi:soluble lytic murein transglycosylase-like protein|nr:lytic transglycosylase domain-containing protein [Candidatus Angelobacter sp.]